MSQTPILNLDTLRRYAVARTLVSATTLERALERFGFVQADPIRAPARAQDLVLRHRVPRYRAGDLERRYPTLPIEEDVFINYGFVSRTVQRAMHPRNVYAGWSKRERARADDLLAFVRAHGEVHPRAVDRHFAHGTVTNYWGGTSSATTHLLDNMHYAGLLRIARREAGVRIYAVQAHVPPAATPAERRSRVDALVDAVVSVYAPLPARSLSMVIGRLRYAAPQWRRELKAAVVRAHARLAHVHTDGATWYWPAGERPERAAPDERVRLLAPFDPIVWDRARFERLWGWVYRFEAYTPVARRQFGYYALPLLWRDRVIGWATVASNGSGLHATCGYVTGSAPRERAFARELEAELERMRRFLGVRS